MRYSFKKTVYVDGDGRKNSYPSVVIENSEKYGSFFLDEINNLSLDYVEEIVGEIEAVLNGEVDFYEGFGFEVYMIECDREKAVVKNVYEDDQVEAIIPIEEVYELMRDWRDFQREYYHNHTSSQKWQGIRLLHLNRRAGATLGGLSKVGEYDQLIRLDRIPTVARETILEVTDKEFPAFRQYLQRDIERYQEPKK